MHDNTGQTEEKIKGRLYGTFGSLRNADAVVQGCIVLITRCTVYYWKWQSISGQWFPIALLCKCCLRLIKKIEAGISHAHSPSASRVETEAGSFKMRLVGAHQTHLLPLSHEFHSDQYILEILVFPNGLCYGRRRNGYSIWGFLTAACFGLAERSVPQCCSLYE